MLANNFFSYFFPLFFSLLWMPSSSFGWYSEEKSPCALWYGAFLTLCVNFLQLVFQPIFMQPSHRRIKIFYYIKIKTRINLEGTYVSDSCGGR